MDRKRRTLQLLSLVVAGAFVFLLPGLGLTGKLETLKVTWHYANLEGANLNAFYVHDHALETMAVEGSDKALAGFLQASNQVDGGQSYSHHNLLIDALRCIDDLRFAKILAQQDAKTKERIWLLVRNVSDLATARPAVHAALGTKEGPDRDGLPLNDQGQNWP